MKQQPIIIIGMHRSGTALLAKILKELGVFIGYKLQEDNESLFFNKINRYIFSFFNIDWDYPKSISLSQLKNNKKVKLKNKINYWLNSKKFKDYLGPNKFEAYKNPSDIDFPWSWKDPRNTYTLPIWLDFFPRAKVIHIYRHGVDVASSLRIRLLKAKSLSFYKQVYSFLQAKLTGRYTRSLKIRLKELGKKQVVYRLEGGLDLWVKYMKEAQNAKNYTDDYFELKYEELLENPVPLIHDLAKFCNITVNETKIKAITSSIKTDRRFAYKNSPELVKFAKEHEDKLKQFGYST